MSKAFTVTVDLEANAAYILMSDEEVARTVAVSDEVMIDLDKFGIAAGIECLRIEAEIPFQKLIDDFHVHSTDVEKLRRLRPSISSSLMSHGAEGTSSVAAGLGSLIATA